MHSQINTMNYETFKKLCARRTSSQLPDAMISLLLSNHENCLAIVRDPTFHFDAFIAELTRLNLSIPILKFRVAENIKRAFHSRDSELLEHCTAELLSLQLNDEDKRFFVFFVNASARDSTLSHGNDNLVTHEFKLKVIQLSKILNECCRGITAKQQTFFCHPGLEDKKVRETLLGNVAASGNLQTVLVSQIIKSLSSLSLKTVPESNDTDLQEAIYRSLNSSRSGASPVLFKMLVNHCQSNPDTANKLKEEPTQHRRSK